MDRIGERLEALLEDSYARRSRSEDPIDFVHRYDDPVDQEVVGLLASSLAFGNALAARRSVGRALEVLGTRPAQTCSNATEEELRERLSGFVHRIYRGDHLAVVLSRAGRLLDSHGSLGSAFEARYEDTGGDFREALALFADALRGEARTRNLRHLVSDPRAGSACKRLLLYARWMVRPDDGIDLGLWSISPSQLVMPVDTHVHRIGRNLGLTERKTASWATAEDITASLRRYDPDDPVKYDFALCHLGVSRECPSRPDLDKCARCLLHPVCTVWEQGRRRRRRQGAA
ncbi:MAG: TIGR02757 family protein [Myxococcota bacterium]